MKLKQQIRMKELQVERAHSALNESMQEMRRVWRGRLSSKAALALSFSGGWVLGWWRLRHRRRQRERLAHSSERLRDRLGLPPHWLGHYLIWPFLLGTAHDYLLSRRAGKGQG
jgi:hypothetical protein